MTPAVQQPGDLLVHALAADPDPFDQAPWKTLLHEKFGLLPLLQRRVDAGAGPLSRRYRRPVHFPQLSPIGAVLKIRRTGI